MQPTHSCCRAHLKSSRDWWMSARTLRSGAMSQGSMPYAFLRAWGVGLGGAVGQAHQSTCAVSNPLPSVGNPLPSILLFPSLPPFLSSLSLPLPSPPPSACLNTACALSTLSTLLVKSTLPKASASWVPMGAVAALRIVASVRSVLSNTLAKRRDSSTACRGEDSGEGAFQGRRSGRAAGAVHRPLDSPAACRPAPRRCCFPPSALQKRMRSRPPLGSLARSLAHEHEHERDPIEAGSAVACFCLQAIVPSRSSRAAS